MLDTRVNGPSPLALSLVRTEAPFKTSSKILQTERKKPETVNLDTTSRKIIPFSSSEGTGKPKGQTTGYPSSDKISRRSNAEETQTKSTLSTVRRFYDSISKEESSRSIKSQISRDSSQSSSSGKVNSQSSSQKVISRSSSRTKSSSIKSSQKTFSRTSSPKSSSKPKSRSSSSKTKKKK